jgi:mitochondrial fission protein ELM1
MTASDPNQAPPTCVLHDGAAGNRRQALALAQALGGPVRELQLDADWLARMLAPRCPPGASTRLGRPFTELLAQPPALAIGCGRIAALATRLLKQAGSRAVQILDPRIDPRHWDVVIAPEHDGLLGDNVVTLIGSLHPIDSAWLARARDDFPALGQCPAPRTAVLLGGPTRAVAFDRSAFEVLMAKLEFWLARDGGSVLLCGSRRTPVDIASVARERFSEIPGALWLDAGDGENFYPGALAWADRIIVSPDSVNMISEACATTAPVFIAEPDRATGRVRRFIASLEARGRVQAQTRDAGASIAAEPLLELPRVVAELHTHLRM